ncbi:MAG: hypothetical protein AAF668_05440 [Pseudomonadota bacterium]
MTVAPLENLKSLTKLLVCILCALITIRGVQAAPIKHRLSGNQVSPLLLMSCDAKAQPYGLYKEKIADAVNSLVELGVFDRRDFGGVAIGYCGFRWAGGPVATTSCPTDIILLDEKYAERGQELSLLATLAHEMRHVQQHRERKSDFDGDYCSSNVYTEERDQLEKEADAFGEAVSSLFVLGRPVEVENKCGVPLKIVLEPEVHASTANEFLYELTPGAVEQIAYRALSRRFWFAADSDVATDARAWPAPVTRRFLINKAAKEAKPIVLSVDEPVSGSFQLTLSCR